MSFPRYPKYKDSGVEWLGEVPVHWEAKRLGSLFSQAFEEGEDNLPILSVSIHDGVSDKELEENELDRKVSRSEDRSKYKKVIPGDLVYNMMRAWQGGFGSVSVLGMVSPAYVVARPKTPLSSEFVEQLLRTPQAVEQMRRLSHGVTDFRLRLYWEEFKSIRIAIPPAVEVPSIIKFIDHETSKIDVLIAEQERLIELLKEKRQAVISHAVTKGLNPNVKLKPSGVEWLGDVPEHWEIRRVKNYFKTCSGGTPNTSLQELYYTSENGIPWIRTTDLNNGFIKEAEIFITEQALADSACAILPVGTVLVAMYGGDGTVGKNGLLEISAAINQAVCGLLPSPSHVHEYVFRYIQFYRPYWMIGAESSRKDPNISQESVQNAPFPRPPLEEQLAIIAHLKRLLSQLDDLAIQSETAIQILHERRTALISAAVTGKIDVRNYVASEAV